MLAWTVQHRQWHEMTMKSAIFLLLLLSFSSQLYEKKTFIDIDQELERIELEFEIILKKKIKTKKTFLDGFWPTFYLLTFLSSFFQLYRKKKCTIKIPLIVLLTFTPYHIFLNNTSNKSLAPPLM